ncbi:hypothetical protein, partial [Neorhizobium galegae]|uniref:hypothetical protein n=1 Tax=Neorhizobium galegae TaxID=399 RepID=UPI00210516B4
MAFTPNVLAPLYRGRGGVSHLPKRSTEEMACCFVPSIGVGEDDVSHFVIALEHPDCTLKKRLRKGGVDHVRRIVAEHFREVG